MKLTDKLISLRKRSGLTQAALAEKLNVSRQAVSLWEMGETFPSTDNFKRLSELYGVSVDYLMRDDAPEPGGAVAVMEGPKAETPRWRSVLLGVFIGLAIALAVALLAATYHVGYDQGVKDATPTYPIHTDVLDEADCQGTADLVGW